MKISEMITLIGEFVYTEIDDVNCIEYVNEKNGRQTAFIIKMENGQQYTLEIKERFK